MVFIQVNILYAKLKKLRQSSNRFSLPDFMKIKRSIGMHPIIKFNLNRAIRDIIKAYAFFLFLCQVFDNNKFMLDPWPQSHLAYQTHCLLNWVLRIQKYTQFRSVIFKLNDLGVYIWEEGFVGSKYFYSFVLD